mgnify:CR=1 FL=1
MRVENDLRNDPIRPLVLRIAIPSMLAQFVSVLYSVVDRIYIGNIPEVGSLALAGAGVCGPIVTMLGSVAFWVGVGGSPLVSIRLGEGRREQAKQIVANAFLLLIVMSLALMGVAYATRRPALMLFGASPETLPYAMEYYSWYLTGTVFALLSTGMNQFVICQGFAQKGMQSVILGAVMNIVLDPLFIFGLKMGVKGAAIATVLSQLCSCLFVLHFLFGPAPQVGISFGGYRPWLMGRILLTGLTPFLIIAVDNLMIIVLNALLQRYGGESQGDLLVAAATISQSFMLVVTMPLGGMTGGTASILGYNLGAGQPKRILEAQKYTLLLSLAYTTTLCLAGLLLAAPFTHIFTPDPRVSALAVTAIHIFSIGVVPLAVQYVIVDGLNGMGMMQFSLPLSFFRKAVYFAALFALPAAFGAVSTFCAETISDLIPPLVTVLFYRRKLGWIREQALSHRAAQSAKTASMTC